MTWYWILGVSCVGSLLVNTVSVAGPIAIGPRAEQDIFEANADPLHVTIGDLVEARRIANAEQLARLAVILQVLADPGEVVMTANAVPLEERTRSNAGQLQDLR